MKGSGESAHRKKAEENFVKRAIFREERKKARDTGERVGDLSWLKELPEKQLFEEWEKISARLTQELEQAKLWHRDNDKSMVPNENGIPAVVTSLEFVYHLRCSISSLAESFQGLVVCPRDCCEVS